MSEEHPPDPSRDEGQRRMAAIMFTDMVGYTAKTQSNEALALSILEDHRLLLRPIFAKHRGREIKTIGDAFLVEFGSALDAVDCAIEMQQAIFSVNSEKTSLSKVQIRIGIHSGDVVERDGDVYGDTVNIASRIEKLAESGGIAISGQVYEQVKIKLTFPASKMGEFQLKNVESPTPVYAVSPVWSGVPSAKPAAAANRIAVLPLRNIGASQDDQYLADGLTEELISSFSSVPSLKVIGRTTAMRFRDSGKSISEIGKELNAGSILEGSIRRAGEHVRVSIQLVDADNEECIWSGKFDKKLEDTLLIQEEIAEDVVTALKGKLGEQRGPGSRRNLTTSGDAFILYLKGRFRLTRHTQVDVEAASKYFEQAVAADPRFASAHAMLAQCRLILGFYGLIPTQQAYSEAQPFLKKAIEIDGDLDIAHMLMGRLLIDRDWDWSGAEAELRRALQLSPNSAEAHYRYALLLNDLGRRDEAVAELLEAEDLDPLSAAVNQVTGTVLYNLGRYADAMERFQRALEIEPRAALAHTNLGLVNLKQGNFDVAIAEITKAIELDPNNIFFSTDLCYAYSQMGKPEDARRVLSEAEARAQGQHVPLVAIAGMRACVGDKAKAIELLEQAYGEHSAYLGSLKVENSFENIRSEPGFISLLSRIGLT